MRSRSPLVVVLVVLLPIFLVGGIWIGGHPDVLPGPLRDAFVDENASTLDQGLGIIERDYYRKLGRSDLVNRLLSGAVTSLDDRFSHYFDPKQYAAFQKVSEGQFSGVGINVTPEKRGLRVASTFPDTPARKAGIKRGDIIVAVGKTSLAGKSTDQSSALIQGKAGTQVTLTIPAPNGKRTTKRVTRAQIDVPSVESRTVKQN